MAQRRFSLSLSEQTECDSSNFYFQLLLHAHTFNTVTFPASCLLSGLQKPPEKKTQLSSQRNLPELDKLDQNVTFV